MLTKNEKKYKNTAKYIFSQNKVLEFFEFGERVAKNKKIEKYNRKIETLKELCREFGIESEKLKKLEKKKPILNY